MINYAAALWAQRPGKVLVSDVEHSSNLLPWLRTGEIVQFQTNNRGKIEHDLGNLLQHESVKLVSFTGCSNLTGYKPCLQWYAGKAHVARARLFVDACQLVPHNKLTMDVRAENREFNIDFAAFSGHKMYAPYGTGVLVGPKKFFDESEPYQIGGGNIPYITSQLKVKRFQNARTHDPGTPNFIGALAIAKSSELLERIGYDQIEKYETSLTKYAHELLSKIDYFIHYSSPTSSESGHTLIPFDMYPFDGRLVAEILAEEHGIGVRAGSFCDYELVRKLKNVSLDEDACIAAEVDRGITKNIPCVVRASIGLQNRLEDIDRLYDALATIHESRSDYYLERYEQNPVSGRWSLRGN